MNSETCSSVRESACCRSYRQLVVPGRWMQPDCPSAAGLPLKRIASFEWTDHVVALAWVFVSGGKFGCCPAAGLRRRERTMGWAVSWVVVFK